MAHHPLLQKEVDELFAKCAIEPLTGGAGFIQMYLWFLCMLVVYDLYFALGDLIAMCTYLLLRCLLSDRNGNLFSR